MVEEFKNGMEFKNSSRRHGMAFRTPVIWETNLLYFLSVSTKPLVLNVSCLIAVLLFPQPQGREFWQEKQETKFSSSQSAIRGGNSPFQLAWGLQFCAGMAGHWCMILCAQPKFNSRFPGPCIYHMVIKSQRFRAPPLKQLTSTPTFTS